MIQLLTPQRLDALLLQNRGELALLCNQRGLKTAIEVGTHQGVFAVEFMHLFDGTLLCIDPWDNSCQADHETFYPNFFEHGMGREKDLAIAKAMLGALYGDRVTFHRGTFEDYYSAASSEVDFIYVDGLHTYTKVWDDLHTAWGILKSGGILAGHDYNSSDPTTFGVVRAVNKFADQYNLDIHLTRDEPASWFMFKP